MKISRKKTVVNGHGNLDGTSDTVREFGKEWLY